PLDSKYCPRTGKKMTSRVGGERAQFERIGVGTLIDRKYKICGFIGRGAQSMVYEAKANLGQLVALKFLAREPNQKALDRFEQEARLAASIAHPSVCRSFDLGVLPSGTRFIVMERLIGHSLRQLLEYEKELDVGLTVHVGAQVASALG